MKHVYVVMDYDALLYACWSKDHAEATVERERRRIDHFIEGASAADKDRVMQAHYLHYQMIPVANPTKE